LDYALSLAQCLFWMGIEIGRYRIHKSRSGSYYIAWELLGYSLSPNERRLYFIKSVHRTASRARDWVLA
jgi:hypothetical protein